MSFGEEGIERFKDKDDRGTRVSDTSFIIKRLCGGVESEFVNRKSFLREKGL